MRYVDVILPLPLEGVFTYALPPALSDRTLFGVRVLVPFGRNKTYTALAVRTHDDEPAFKVKETIAALDAEPVVTPLQWRFWQWVADYYLCPVGEVYKAAMPSGL